MDIYGSCGSLKCPRRDSECIEMLKTYKFYLAFENSNCRDYVTEKLFMNALQNGVVPIVMGASVEDYAAIAPPHSFLHVDNYNSPADLANHLEILAKDENLYNEFLEWRTQGEWLRTRFFCRVCAMLHYHQEHGPSTGVEGGWGQWWGGKGVCRAAGSRQAPKRKNNIIDGEALPQKLLSQKVFQIVFLSPFLRTENLNY